MPKFEGADDEGFKAVSGEVRRWIRNSDDIYNAAELPVVATPRELPPGPAPSPPYGRYVINGDVMGGSVAVIGNVNGGNIGGVRCY